MKGREYKVAIAAFSSFFLLFKEKPMYETELYHHGVKGQHWGVRRYQNYDGTLTAKGKKRDLKTAGQYKRALNRIDQGLAEEGHYLKKANSKFNKASNKQDKLVEKQLAAFEAGNFKKGMSLDKKVNKAMKKTNMALDEVEAHKKYIEAGQKLSNRLINEAKQKGYKVESKEVSRIANTGHYYVHAYLLGAPISAARNAEYVAGKHYKVSKPKNDYKPAKPYNTTKPVRPTKSEARDLATMEADDTEFNRDVERIKKNRRK